MSTVESHCCHLLFDSLGIVNHTLCPIKRTEFVVDSIGGVSMNWKNEAIEKLEQNEKIHVDKGKKSSI